MELLRQIAFVLFSAELEVWLIDSCVNIRYFDFPEAFNLVPHNISI